MRIERHKITHPGIERIYTEALKRLSDYQAAARERAGSLTYLKSVCQQVAFCGSVLAPEAPEIGRALRMVSQTCAAVFAVANSQGQSVTVPLGEGPAATYSGVKADESTVNALLWLNGYMYATLCHDAESLKILCATPVATLRASSTKSAAYDYLLIEALQRWHTGQEGVAEGFIAAMQATEPGQPDIVSPTFTLHIDVPWIQCLFYAAAEQSEFGEALANGVGLHKKYWAKTATRRDDWDGFLSFPMLAAAALAHRRNLPFDVDSEYLPMRLVRGDF